MPMGITADIYEGKDVSLREYLMRVGRGMGFAVLQRDSDMDEPVKPTTSRTDYYDESEVKATARLAELRALDGDALVRAARADFEERHRLWVERHEEREALRERYEDMLAQAQAWQPDPLVASTKDYAIKYLRESIEFDCGSNRDRYDLEPTEEPPAEWLAAQIEDAERDLEYARKHRAEELERTEERNRHIEAFLSSLPGEPARVS